MKHIKLVSIATALVIAVLALVDRLFPHLPPYPDVRPIMGILVFACAFFGRQLAMAGSASQEPSEVKARITNSILMAIALITLMGSIWVVSLPLIKV